jgi:hypothetical protein
MLVPVANPANTPVVAFIVPTAGSDDDHVPPTVADVSVVVWPIHAPGTPPIIAGCALTVKVVVAIQPVGRV